MAVTTESSTQFTKLSTPSTKGGPIDGGGGLVAFAFDHTQGVAAGDVGSTVNLIQVPPGRWEFLGHVSMIENSAFGLARVLDIGWLAYTTPDGATAAAAAAGLNNDLDVAAAGVTVGLGAALGVNTARRKVFDSKAGVTIQAIIAGDTWPAAAQIHGVLMFVAPTS